MHHIQPVNRELTYAQVSRVTCCEQLVVPVQYSHLEGTRSAASESG